MGDRALFLLEPLDGDGDCWPGITLESVGRKGVSRKPRA